MNGRSKKRISNTQHSISNDQMKKLTDLSPIGSPLSEWQGKTSERKRLSPWKLDIGCWLLDIEEIPS